MKKVLLLGDSIRMGYDDYVKELLKDTCEVYYDADDNGRFSSYTLWQANQMFRKYGAFDIVHWNNGYWDMNIEEPMTVPLHPVDEYLHFCKRIIGEIRRNGAEVIYATTLPVLTPGQALDNTGTEVTLHYHNDWVVTYNEAAVKLMNEEHVAVNDLYTLMLEDPHYYKCADSLHLTETGYQRCAQQIADMIREKLGQ